MGWASRFGENEEKKERKEEGKEEEKGEERKKKKSISWLGPGLGVT